MLVYGAEINIASHVRRENFAKKIPLTRFERATPSLGRKRSIQLSYRGIFSKIFTLHNNNNTKLPKIKGFLLLIFVYEYLTSTLSYITIFV